jgi:hypothetical protein
MVVGDDGIMLVGCWLFLCVLLDLDLEVEVDLAVAELLQLLPHAQRYALDRSAALAHQDFLIIIIVAITVAIIAIIVATSSHGQM